MSNYVTKRGEFIPLDTRQLIARRYHTVTKAVNREFWGRLNDDTSNSFYVGSYGRGTAIDSSDIDILVSLPKAEYNKYSYTAYNGQSRLLQAVRSALLDAYPRSQIKADGQVVKIDFSDGMKFEILPAFKQDTYGYGWGLSSTPTYTYPDSNMGGNWKSTNPKAEQEAMAEKNKSSNGLLYDTCKHIRYIRDNFFSSYHLSGIVIDSFVYKAMGDWKWIDTPNPYSRYTPGDYEKVLYDYAKQFEYWGGFSLVAPGSNQDVNTKDSYNCLLKVLAYMIK